MAERIEVLTYQVRAETQGFTPQIAAASRELDNLAKVAGGKGVPQIGALGGALSTVTTRTHGAREGMGKLQNAVIEFGKHAAGLPNRGPLGRLIEGLGLLTLGSPIVIGIAAAAAAIGLAWDKLTEKTRKLKEQTEEFVKAQSKAARTQFLGPNADVSQGITAAQQRLAEIKRRQEQRVLVQQEVGSKGSLIFSLIFGTKEALDKEAREIADAITQGGRTIQQRGQDLVRGLKDQIATFGNPFAAQRTDVVRRFQAGEITNAQQNEAIALINRLEALEKRAAASKKAGKGDEAAAKALADIRAEIEKVAAAATVSALDEFDRSVAEFAAKAAEAKLPAEEFTAALVRLREQREALVQAEDTDAFIASFDEALVHVDGLKQSFNDITRAVERQKKVVDALPKGSKDREKAEQQLNKLLGQQTQRYEQIRDVSGEVVAETGQSVQVTEDWRQKLAEVATTAADIAQGVLGIANALGIADGKTGQLLSNFINLGRQIPGILSGDPTAIFSGLGSLGGIVGGLVGGESPEEKARKAELRHNTLALQKLSERIGDLARFSSSGADLDRTKQSVAAILADPRFSQITRFTKGELSDENLRFLGGDPELLRQVAEQAGFEIGTAFSRAELEAIQQALEKETERGEFADTFAAQMEAFQREVDILDLDEPTKQFDVLRRRLDKVKDGAGVLGRTLAGLDLTTAEGVEAARKALQDLFRQIPNLTDTDFGGLNRTEFLDAIQAALGVIDAAGQQLAAGGPQGTGGFNVSREITEVTGGRLVGRLDTANAWLQETAFNTAEIARLMGSTAIRVPSLPSIVPGAPQTATVQVSFGDINVTVSGVTSVASGGATIASGIATELNRLLGTEQRLRTLALGTSVQTQRAV
jgi:hypothetical protein